MAIRIRRGNQIDFDKNKLVQGELAIVLDAGELHFCYGPGNTKKLATKEDLQEMLDMSETSFSALIQLITDLENDPNELTNILSNISALQTNVSSLQANKIDKTSIVNTDTINDTTKVPSTAVTYGLGQEIDTLTNNLDPLKLGLHMIENIAISGISATLSHTMNKSDFNSAGVAFLNTGTYLLVTTSWGTAPSTGLYLISYSGGATTNSTLTTIVAQDGATVTATSGVISASGSMARIRLYAFS